MRQVVAVAMTMAAAQSGDAAVPGWLACLRILAALPRCSARMCRQHP